MRFRKGQHVPHPPRGPGRGRYHMSDAARRARRRNLAKSRLRSDRESRIIKVLIWQSCFDSGPRPSQRVLARQLGVYPSYVCKVQKQTEKGLDALANGQRVTAEDLTEARKFTLRLREQEPGLLALSRREVQGWKDDPLGHGWNCKCACCRIKRAIDDALREAGQDTESASDQTHQT